MAQARRYHPRSGSECELADRRADQPLFPPERNQLRHASQPDARSFHLYEFREESFRQNGRRLGYELAEVRFDTCVINRVPARPLFRWYMDRTNRGMMISVFLRKPA